MDFAYRTSLIKRQRLQHPSASQDSLGVFGKLSGDALSARSRQNVQALVLDEALVNLLLFVEVDFLRSDHGFELKGINDLWAILLDPGNGGRNDLTADVDEIPG